MISTSFKSVTTLALAVGFTVATLASCGAKKEKSVEEVAPPVIKEVPADTTMMDTTAGATMTTE